MVSQPRTPKKQKEIFIPTTVARISMTPFMDFQDPHLEWLHTDTPFPFLFWGSKFPLPSREREGEESSIAASVSFLLFSSFPPLSLVTSRSSVDLKKSPKSLNLSWGGKQPVDNMPGKRKCGCHADLRCKSQWKSVISQGCTPMGVGGGHSSAWVQCPGIWVAIEGVHIASHWLTSKSWPQPHTKAHLGTRGLDPEGRKPHAESSVPPKLSQELQGKATLFFFVTLTKTPQRAEWLDQSATGRFFNDTF